MANQLQQINTKEMSDQIQGRVQELGKEGLALPKNYNVSNALNSAFLQLKQQKGNGGVPVLNKVTPTSISETLFDMVLQGLSPAKNQVYFIPYGDKLTMQRSYFGTQTAVKRLNGVKDIYAQVVHEGDTFEIGQEKGRYVVKTFEPKFENLDNQIIAAFAVIELNDDEMVTEVMTKKQIETSWSQGKTSNVQKKFPEEMAKRTVINRLAKNFINTSDDSDMMVYAINQTTASEFADNDIEDAEVVQEEKAHSDKAKQLLNEFKNNPEETITEAKEEHVEHTETTPDEEINANNETKEPQSFEEMTIKQLQEALDGYRLPYSKNARKSELLQILDNYLGGGNSGQEELF